MDTVLINQKTLKQRKTMKQIQKEFFRKYGRVHGAVVKGKLGKLVRMSEQTGKLSSPNITFPDITQEELLRKLQKSQLTGMSGNRFPTAQKVESFLRSQSRKRVLVINGVECEPGLLHDEWLLEQYPNEIRAGIKLLCKALKISHSVLAVKVDSKLEGTDIEVRRVPERYPMGEEHVLIHQLFDILMEKKEHPAENGFLVLNVQTVYQIYQLCNGSYQEGRYVTLANIDTGEAKVVFAKYGESIRRTLEDSFGKQKGVECYAGGGILSAHPVGEEECFEGAVSFAAIGVSAHIFNENACKKCGKCTRKCPMGVNVKEIVRRREQNQDADVTGLGLEKCIHCNSCTYFCKAGKNIASMLV